jgi:hypothetical protein
MRSPFIAALLLVAACENLPVLLPPGFGGGETPQANSQFFFPTGIAVMPDKTLLVANGNFSHLFAGGTMISVDADFIHGIFEDNQSHDCGAEGVDTGGFPCTRQLSETGAVVSGVMIGNYAGPIGLDDAADAGTPEAFAATGGGTAYVGSRDSNTVDAIHVDPGGQLTCLADAGVTPNDCRQGLINTATATGADGNPVNLDGPYSIVSGDASPLGQPSERVMFVSSLVPHVEDIESGIPITTSEVTVLSQANPGVPLFTMIASGEFIGANGAGIGPMLYDGTRRRLVLGGCYQRFGGTGAGEPATSKCTNTNLNQLRFMGVDGGATVVPSFVNLFGDLESVDLSSMVFADFDPATHEPTSLYATLRNPDVLAKISLPLDQSVAPRLNTFVTLPAVPSDLVLISRASQGLADLVAVASERTSAIVIYDSGVDQVVANVQRVGDSPTSLRLYEMTTNDAGEPVARLVTGAFAGCSVAFIEVPLNDPASSQLRGRIGACEE